MRGILFNALVSLFVAASLGQTGGRRIETSAKVFARRPLAFEVNQGQVRGRSDFLARGRGHTLLLNATQATLKMRDGVDLRMKLSGGNPDARPQAMDRLRGKMNYLTGRDSRAWRTGIPTFQKIQYKNVYPGIDVVYYGNQDRLEYDFVVAPGADPGLIRLDFEGARHIEVEPAGGLVLETGVGSVHQRPPTVYQIVHGVRREVLGHYVLNGKSEAAFALDAYDRQAPLIIDPVLEFSSYFGDINDDRGTGIAVDKDGYAYVVGWSESPEDKNKKAFVLKIDPSGKELVYGTLLGGSGDDYGYGIALDAAGNACVTGRTSSKNFPIGNGFLNDTTRISSGFVAKLNGSGDALMYSSYLDSEEAAAIAVDEAGIMYVTGTARQDSPITANALQKIHGGSDDAFVMKIDPAAQGTDSLLYSTYLGGSLADSGAGIALDKDGNIYVTGKTVSPDFPVANALQSRYHDGPDAFVAKINREGSAFFYSTYLGTDHWDAGNGIAVDTSGNAYVIGLTNSKVFPTTPGAYQRENGGGFCDVNISALRDCFDAFVAKLNPNGSALLYSTLLGGQLDQDGRAIAVDAAGNAYVTGKIWGPNLLPMSKLNAPGSALIFSVFDKNARGNSIALDRAGNVWVTGETRDPFPLERPLQGEFGGGFNDAFIVKLSQTPEEQR